MDNEASILFNFNAEIETNKVSTQVKTTLSIDQNIWLNLAYSLFRLIICSISQILIYNYTGQLILSQNLESPTNNKTINISNIASGLYFLEIKDVNGTRGMKKVMKN